MRQMFRQFFAMISSFFAAGEKLASACNHVADYVDKSAAQLVAQQIAEQQLELAKLGKEAKLISAK